MNTTQAALIAKAREAVRPLGYAIAVHGSMTRDLDRVAYSIYGVKGAGPARYIDLSITPRLPVPE